MTISLKKYEKTLGWIFLAMTPLALPMLIVYLCQLLPVQPDQAQLNIVAFVTNFVLTVLIFHRFLVKSLALGLSRPGRTLMWMGISFGVYNIGNYLITLLITLLAPDFANANDANITAMLQEHFWPMAICIVVLVPITEETLYRGLIFGSLRNKSRFLAYLVSAVAFSALHLIGYIGTLHPFDLLISFLQYLPGAAALALAYDKSDSIWPSIVIHATNNLLALLFMR